MSARVALSLKVYNGVAQAKKEKKKQKAQLKASQPAGSMKHELRICTNKTCKKQGSKEIVQFAQDLGLEELDVTSCGCLGNCGKGPNAVLLPLELQLNHVSTTQRLAEVLKTLCGIEVSEAHMKATELRLAGNSEARSGDLKRAIDLYTQGIDLHPPRGIHMLLANRAGARLGDNDPAGAAEDADKAADLAPPGFTTAAIRQVEAYAALKRYDIAAKALLAAGEKDPHFARSAEYKSIVMQLQRLLTSQPQR